MMKKVFLSLLMTVVCLPALFAQADAGHVIKIDSVATCGNYKWERNGQVYEKDTVALYTTPDTTFILNLVKLSSYIDTLDIIELEGNCEASWEGMSWTTSGTYFDTLASVLGCDSVVKVHVTIAADDSVLNEVVCGSYIAPWGKTYTEDTYLDTLVVVGDCEMRKILNLTVNPEYDNIEKEVETGCYYKWAGLVITDNDPHTETLTTLAGCDSVVTITVTNYTGVQKDTVKIVACDFYKPDWRDTIFESGLYTQDFVDAEMGDCETHRTFDVTIVPSFNDTINAEPVSVNGGCFYVWNNDTITDNNVHYHLYSSVVGGCDSLAAIKVVYSGIKDDTTRVSYCGAHYIWSNYNKALPTQGVTYDYTTDTVVSVSVPNEDTSCTTRYTLVLTMVNKYDTIEKYYCGEEWVYGVGSSKDKFKVEDPITHYLVDGVDTLRSSGMYSQTPDGRPYIVLDNQTNQCRTYRTVNLTLRNPEQRYHKEDHIVSACDEYKFKADAKRGDDCIFKGVQDQVVNVDTILIHKEHSTSRTGNCYDSIAHLVLTIYSRSVTNQTVSACDSYEWVAGDTVLGVLTASGDYRDTLEARTEHGCLQIDNLKLTINKTPVIDIQGEWVLEPGQSTVLHAVPTTDSDPIARYKWFVNGAEQSGNVDSIVLNSVMENTDVRLESTSNHNCTATNWITITSNVGIDEVESLQVNVYPNPASRYLHVESNDIIRSVIVFNSLGQQVLVREVNGNQATLDLGNLGTGNYMMRLVGENGTVSMRKFIVNK